MKALTSIQYRTFVLAGLAGCLLAQQASAASTPEFADAGWAASPTTGFYRCVRQVGGTLERSERNRLLEVTLPMAAQFSSSNCADAKVGLRFRKGKRFRTNVFRVGFQPDNTNIVMPQPELVYEIPHGSGNYNDYHNTETELSIRWDRVNHLPPGEEAGVRIRVRGGLKKDRSSTLGTMALKITRLQKGEKPTSGGGKPPRGRSKPPGKPGRGASAPNLKPKAPPADLYVVGSAHVEDNEGSVFFALEPSSGSPFCQGLTAPGYDATDHPRSEHQDITVPNIRWGVKNDSNIDVRDNFSVELRYGGTTVDTRNVSALRGGDTRLFTYKRPQSRTCVARVGDNHYCYHCGTPDQGWNDNRGYQVHVDVGDRVDESNELDNGGVVSRQGL